MASYLIWVEGWQGGWEGLGRGRDAGAKCAVVWRLGGSDAARPGGAHRRATGPWRVLAAAPPCIRIEGRGVRTLPPAMTVRGSITLPRLLLIFMPAQRRARGGLVHRLAGCLA